MLKRLLTLACVLVGLSASAQDVEVSAWAKIGEGFDGEKEIATPKPITANAAGEYVVAATAKVKNAWDSQLWIGLDAPVDKTTIVDISFSYKADAEAKVTTQTHAAPTQYKGDGIGDLTFTTEWQEKTARINFVEGVQTIAFNLNEIDAANTYYIKDVKMSLTIPETWECPDGEVDITTLEWVNNGQGCTKDFGRDKGTVFGTDAGGANLSYVDISKYSAIKFYGEPSSVRVFINRAENFDPYIFHATIGEDGVGIIDLHDVVNAQSGLKYIHLNGVKAGPYYNSTTTVFGITLVPAAESIIPEPMWECPAGEVDITTLEWVNNGQGCTREFGKDKGTVFGTDAGGANLSYVDITNYTTIKIYGEPSSVRAFINRSENDPGTFQFHATIDESGVAVINLADVFVAQEGATYIHLNGIKAGPTSDSKATVYGISLIPKPAVYNRDVTSGDFGTIALRYSATIEGATLYEVETFDAEKGLVLSEVAGDMVKGTPYIFQATANKITCTQKDIYEAQATGDNTANEIGNGLVGMYVNFDYVSAIVGKGYVIQNNKLCKIGDAAVKVTANHCFFDPDKYKAPAAPTAGVRLPVEGAATAIQSITNAAKPGKIYDMNGREVKAMQKGGMYIMNGMKVYVK